MSDKDYRLFLVRYFMSFADLGLSKELLQAVAELGYEEPTPVQATAIPSVLMMRDLIAVAQTGTGKTASFVLPMIDILAHGRCRARMPRSLILEPTRELAAQVAENFEKYGKYHKLSMSLLIGGVPMAEQQAALEKGVDVLIATPGRLLDLFERGKILLSSCEMLVIDEADRMLDMGFIPDIETICTKLPTSRQTLLFSATMPPAIKKLADRFLSNPKQIEISRPATANTLIDQRLIEVSPRSKKKKLCDMLRAEKDHTAIIFCNRKTTVRQLATTLEQQGFSVGQIHGDMSQPERGSELERFKNGQISVLVASDIAARGLDVKGISHVFNFDVPTHPDDYIHRIGRTGRGGASGEALTFVTPADEEAIAAIEKLMGVEIPRLGNRKKNAHPSKSEEAVSPKQAKPAQEKSAAPSPRKAPRKAETPKKSPEDRLDSVESDFPKNQAPRNTASRPVSKARTQERALRPENLRRVKPVALETAIDWNGPIPPFLNYSVPKTTARNAKKD
ncbi:DEAD/DEAH box helicase [Zymomonas mobilis]|uniref:DEAD-box ATP-dependent RNA helicase RhpA n=1 Tax=Zymomonas mobilis subsp. mobilis (strain ATCC 10988 / DSM 424 / LMG 404 / NCIMB 8938 / NRRL B-806 / ZM1) TaxID=555217 RepID=A0A0H3FVY8_ZYMMA|nr:DEAD/DEAH box helicase [Zymomonas mobilis]AEH61973.1 DEAD/DEAH box helicase domain protein [Zymomonas mobilis subsp. mobilis ATCC 10988]TQL28432.1 superfamily II DNA/RNA helicase [Zymomonas mobilis]TQL30368.1 superfamily II DNA/RNA helicase [Zymomonas mobilis]